jgi:enoyl-CoA hydratase/carnithine racemase
MLGDAVTAERADRIGLVTNLVEDADLDAATTALARRLADGPAWAYAQTKMLLSRELDMSLSASVEFEAVTQALLMKGEDYREFHAAFTGKREPRWSGR